MFKKLTTNLVFLFIIIFMLGAPLAAVVFSVQHRPTTPPVVSAPSVPPDTPEAPKPTQTTIVQFSSHSTVKEAQKALVSLQSGGLFDITDVRLYKASLPNGIWYRVAIPVEDLNAGNKLCAAWKAKGNDCLVLQFS